MDLLLWFVYDEFGNICRLARIDCIPGDFDIELYFKRFFEPPYGGGGITHAVRERVVIPDTLIGIEGIATVLYVGDKRFRAVIPYYSVLKP